MRFENRIIVILFGLQPGVIGGGGGFGKSDIFLLGDDMNLHELPAVQLRFPADVVVDTGLADQKIEHRKNRRIGFDREFFARKICGSFIPVGASVGRGDRHAVDIDNAEGHLIGRQSELPAVILVQSFLYCHSYTSSVNVHFITGRKSSSAERRKSQPVFFF